MYLNKKLFQNEVPICILLGDENIALLAEMNGISSFYRHLSDNVPVSCFTMGTSTLTDMTSMCAILPIEHKNLQLEIANLSDFPMGLFDARKLINDHVFDLDVPENISDYTGIIVPDRTGATSRYLHLLRSQRKGDYVARTYLEHAISPIIFMDESKMEVISDSRREIIPSHQEIMDNMMALESKKQAYATMFGSVLPVLPPECRYK